MRRAIIDGAHSVAAPSGTTDRSLQRSGATPTLDALATATLDQRSDVGLKRLSPGFDRAGRSTAGPDLAYASAPASS